MSNAQTFVAIAAIVVSCYGFVVFKLAYRQGREDERIARRLEGH